MEKLEKEMVSLLDELDTLDAGSDEYTARLEQITKLYKTLNEEKKLSLDSRKIDIENDKIIKEMDYKNAQLETEAKKIESDVNIKSSQLKLERDKAGNDYELRERQLMDEDERFKAELKLKEADLENRINEIINDRDVKLKELKGNNIGQYVKMGVDVLAIVAPLVLYGTYMNKGFKFEETGTFTSQTLKGLVGKFKTTR